MTDFNIRSDNVDVEQIMRQIRARIREKRGVDYTEEEVHELAKVKLEKFIDPKGVRSGLLDEHQRLAGAETAPPNFEFGEDTLYETHRAPIRWIRSLLRPFLKLLFNPNPLIQALHIQADLNRRNAEHNARLDALYYEVIHNLVVELTRTGIEVKSLKMRLESMASRLDFDERRARALEGVVQYRPGTAAPLQPPTGPREERRPQGQGPQGQAPNALDNEGNERRSRRRRRRGRRRGSEGRGPVTDARGGNAEAAQADRSPADRSPADRTPDGGHRASDPPGASGDAPETPPPPDRSDS
jgi:hypothetical protein